MPLRLPIPIPVVLFGRSATVGKPVSELLRPEYEVIHFIVTPEEARAELPRLLAGRDPQSASPNDVGSHNYSQPPRVAIFGRGYNPDFVQELKKVCGDDVRQPVAWVVGEPSKAPTAPPPPGYGKLVADEVKGVLETWREEGGAEDAFILY
ncbi:hypothetical protein BDW59DRAFT_160935 [Aspergillus cavernicola]|uniref:NAD(P)-binding domain-containing protein n=1 Tax=Aspergillus cavernicola TaxID=176166 RepID=A0ABR4IF85_9EURO